MAGDLVDLTATSAKLLETHKDGPLLVTRLAELARQTVTPALPGNSKRALRAPQVDVVTPRPRMSSAVAEAVISFAERIAREGGLCAWEAGITEAEAEVADRLFRDGLINDAAEFLDDHVAAPGGGDWIDEPVWAGIQSLRLDWRILAAQRDWERGQGYTPGHHSEVSGG